MEQLNKGQAVSARYPQLKSSSRTNKFKILKGLQNKSALEMTVRSYITTGKRFTGRGQPRPFHTFVFADLFVARTTCNTLQRNLLLLTT